MDDRPHRVLIAALAVVATGLWWTGAANSQSGRIKPSAVVRPAGTKPFAGNPAMVLAAGAHAHEDTSLSPIQRSCSECHADPDSYNATFTKPWPHVVDSVKKKTGLDTITAEGMVQFCMISALGTKPLPWDSDTLASLTAFVLERHAKVVKP